MLFVREAIDRADAVARETGARIVHACGYDSIPSDLAVLLLHERAAAGGAGGLNDVRLVATARGGLSGGTIDSIRAQIDAMRRDPAARRLAADPFALSPDRAAEPDVPRDEEVARAAGDLLLLEPSLVLRPRANEYDVIPQDWWNESDADFGYQWITRVGRDPKSGRLVGDGIRIEPFKLDASGRRREDG